MMQHTPLVSTCLGLPTLWPAQCRLSRSTDSSLGPPALAEWSCSSRVLKVICMAAAAAVIHIAASVVANLHDPFRTTAMQEARAVVPEAGPWLSLILDARSAVMDVQSFTLPAQCTATRQPSLKS